MDQNNNQEIQKDIQQTLVSHGQQGDQFMCFLGSQEEEQMNLEVEQEALIEQQHSSEIVNLGKGEYQIYFDLNKQSQEIKNKINDILQNQLQQMQRWNKKMMDLWMK